MSLFNRRDWLKVMAAGGAGALIPLGSRASALASDILDLTVDGPAPLWLLTPLGPGSWVGNGWSIESLSPVRRGAVVLTLRSDAGETARVHLCRKGAAPKGIAHSRHLDFILMNGSDGSAPSDEGLGLVLKTIARRVTRNERLARRQLANNKLACLDDLEPHDQRVRRYGAETLV